MLFDWFICLDAGVFVINKRPVSFDFLPPGLVALGFAEARREL
jgi:hypothetical protein